MLEILCIRNFAVIEDASVEFSSGFNVLTGETGAGKSMIVQALELLRGERAQSHLVRKGADSAVVEAQFHLENPPESLLQALSEQDISPEEDTLIVERVILAQGRGRQRIGGRLTTTGALARIVPLVIEVSSQHDHQRLLSAAFALDVVDAFGGIQHHVLREKLDETDLLAKRLEELQTARETRDQLRETLEFSVRELTEASLVPGEHGRLLTRKKRLSFLRDIIDAARFADESLAGDDSAALARLHAVISRLGKLSHAEPKFPQATQLLEDARILIQEAVHLLESVEGEDVDGDENLEWIEERLYRLGRLMKKYHCPDEAALLEELENCIRAQGELMDVDQELARVAKKLDSTRNELENLAHRIGEQRKNAAARLSEEVSLQLRELGFSQARFFVELSINCVRADTPEHRRFGEHRLGQRGFEQATFWFEPNPGQSPQPVGRGASGGELSRIHLALQVVLARHFDVAVTLYDEVDAGIGGQVAGRIADKLRQLSHARQILCITHLPQIAAAANSHFVVEKQVLNGQTLTSIRKLDPEERVMEIARMLGSDSPEALAHARHLLGES